MIIMLLFPLYFRHYDTHGSECFDCVRKSVRRYESAFSFMFFYRLYSLFLLIPDR